jgi:hypothetical protein
MTPSSAANAIYGELPNCPECGGFCLDARFSYRIRHLIVTMVRLARPDGRRSVVAESVLVRHQLLILNRGAQGVPQAMNILSDRAWLRSMVGLTSSLKRTGCEISSSPLFT